MVKKIRLWDGRVRRQGSTLRGSAPAHQGDINLWTGYICDPQVDGPKPINWTETLAHEAQHVLVRLTGLIAVTKKSGTARPIVRESRRAAGPRIIPVLLCGVLLGGCGGVGQSDEDAAILTATLSAAPDRIRDVDPILVHPRRLRLIAPDNPYPGSAAEHYEPEPWPELQEAAVRASLPLCQVGEDEVCVIDESAPLPGFIAVSEIVKSPATARVHLVATEFGTPHGYAAIYYEVSLEKREGSWAVTTWRAVSSAN